MATEKKFYVLTEEEMKQLLHDQQCMDENTDWIMRIGMSEEDKMPILPPLLNELQAIVKITRND
jgi:hypothetical protein